LFFTVSSSLRLLGGKADLALILVVAELILVVAELKLLVEDM
jgi:hypothetical protein